MQAAKVGRCHGTGCKNLACVAIKVKERRGSPPRTSKVSRKDSFCGLESTVVLWLQVSLWVTDRKKKPRTVRRRKDDNEFYVISAACSTISPGSRERETNLGRAISVLGIIHRLLVRTQKSLEFGMSSLAVGEIGNMLEHDGRGE
jgi:hypothetical protein